MPRSFTATTITLTPKTDSPQTWSDFKPISLCNVTNKILSKLLYNKMSALLPSMISPSQSGFVPGRLIGDNILLAQELTHSIDQRFMNLIKHAVENCWFIVLVNEDTTGSSNTHNDLDKMTSSFSLTLKKQDSSD
ncbi:UNVERIFIED_CONTAM: hypothetical protein Scaly_2549700 [Sesamum calycinum]|uniref:Reverse transcriptase domain-containing protein n=1 Tax=Sesamum calycinum TaxID=2727403 RepID=A0AAW2J0G1_9LAMI